jgi:hypothetical protein
MTRETFTISAVAFLCSAAAAAPLVSLAQHARGVLALGYFRFDAPLQNMNDYGEAKGL